MNVSEAIVARLRHLGVRDVFMLSGGYIMSLTDALGRDSALRYWCNYHEQACAIAAEAYARITGHVGVCLVTAGPGATNALSAVAGSWVESVPIVVLSGQVRRNLIADHSQWRQMGPQEIDIIEMARPVTKYSAEILDPADALPALDEAWQAATSGRPGPVWLSLPLDVQGFEIGAAESAVRKPPPVLPTSAPAQADLDRVVGELEAAKRPVVACGNGVHLAHAEDIFDAFVRRYGLPVVSAIGGMDVLHEDHPLYFGRFGPTGQRRANFVLQNADLLLCIGTSLSVAAAGFNTEELAPGARRILINVDPGEMTRPHLRTDVAVLADAGAFLQQMVELAPSSASVRSRAWRETCAGWKRRYPILTDDYLGDPDHVNSYVLAYELSKALDVGDVVVTGNSLDAVSIFHSYAVRPGQRVIANTNFGAMGWDLPAALGASIARPRKRTVLVTGDGSLMLNSQELLTIGSNGLNVKVFVLNNGGYQSIRGTQQTFCSGRLVGCDKDSGVANPRFHALAEAFGLQYARLDRAGDIAEVLAKVLTDNRPWLVEVNVAYEQERVPSLRSHRREDGVIVTPPLHDQYPYLPREELDEVMRASGQGLDI